jgi:hypothetical protein
LQEIGDAAANLFVFDPKRRSVGRFIEIWKRVAVGSAGEKDCRRDKETDCGPEKYLATASYGSTWS